MTTTTILLDLDNTLLGNDMHNFLPPYFVSLGKRLREFIDSKDLQQLLINSVQTMMDNQDPDVSNMAVFWADFSRRIGYPIEVLQPAIDAFYAQEYPRLQQYTHFRPQAQPLIRRLFDDGYQVVIATNPLFPATAIEQRLDWAGVNGFPYALVTTMENSHFAKPNPRYYQEILAKVNSAPQSTWMVGDNLQHDIAPARSLGLKTWWINDDTQHSAPAQPPPACDKQGTLAELLAWIEAGGLAL